MENVDDKTLKKTINDLKKEEWNVGLWDAAYGGIAVHAKKRKGATFL